MVDVGVNLSEVMIRMLARAFEGGQSGDKRKPLCERVRWNRREG